MQKQGRILSRKGRQERNKPRVSQSLHTDAVYSLMKSYGVRFDDYPFEDRYWALYKALLMIAPYLSSCTGLPLSMYGYGCFRPRKSSKRSRDFNFSPSRSFLESLDSFGDPSGNIPADISRLLEMNKKQDISILEVSYEY